MGEELFSLKMLLVSGVAAERESVRRAASEASFPIEIIESDPAGEAAEARALLQRDAIDLVFSDSRIPRPVHLQLIEAARACKQRPLSILVGPAALKTREVLTDGLPIDGVLGKPIDAREARQLIDNCARARAPSRVLIVDDSATVRSVIRKVLQSSRFGLLPEEAADGTTAIEAARKRPFHIMFVDCHMPDPDGFATLAEVKRMNPATRVVMITGMRDMRIEDRARAEGAIDFLYKPFFANDINQVLCRLFGLAPPR